MKKKVFRERYQTESNVVEKVLEENSTNVEDIVETEGD